MINKINCAQHLLKSTLLVMFLCFMTACQQNASKNKSQPQKKQKNIVRLHSKGTFSEVVQFLHAYRQGVSRGVCETFFSLDNRSNEPCIMTRNGNAYLIVRANSNKGFRVSKLKLINKNKFINIDDESIWYLEPYN